MGQQIVLLSLFTFTLYLVVGLKLGTKDIQVLFFTASLLPLRKENLIPLEINLANVKLDMEGVIKTVKRW